MTQPKQPTAETTHGQKDPKPVLEVIIVGQLNFTLDQVLYLFEVMSDICKAGDKL